MKKLQRLVKKAATLRTKINRRRIKDKIYYKNRKKFEAIMQEIINEAVFFRYESLYELITLQEENK